MPMAAEWSQRGHAGRCQDRTCQRENSLCALEGMFLDLSASQLTPLEKRDQGVCSVGLRKLQEDTGSHMLQEYFFKGGSVELERRPSG